jgi:5-methyltetrahydropteroyltriglutamate--homocysteine methyltransferase
MSNLRADHIGSLLRPPQLLQAWGQLFAGQLSPDALDDIENRAIDTALEGQQRSGIDVYTDGEFRRIVYLTSLNQAVDGFEMTGGGERLEWHATGREVPKEMVEFELPIVVRKLTLKSRVAGHESEYMRAHSPGQFKITIPSPMHFIYGGWKAGITDSAYPTPFDLLQDITRILADEAGQLAREGVTYVQLDAPTYTQFLDPSWESFFARHGFSRDQLLREAMAADNAILDAAHGGGAVTGIHLCRGNGMGAWLATGGYDPIAEQLFSLHADRFLLEYDTERAGTFEPLRLVPADRAVVLGLVSTKESALESEDELRRRIDEASAYVPMERLALSPQCGFASDMRGNPISEADQWRKLELVATVADKAWSGVAAPPSSQASGAARA